MRARWMAIVGIGLLSAEVSAGAPTTKKEKASYAMGVSVARNVQRQQVDVDADVLARGLRDALSGQKLALTEDELRSTMDALMAEAKEKRRESAARTADRKAAGDAFRAENARKEGVVTLPSGVQYRVLAAGSGQKPADGDTVSFQYRGAYVDGKVFDSSFRRGRPTKLSLSRTPPAWREVLKLMPVGSKWQIVVPPDSSAANRVHGRKKGPRNETLVFELQLLAVEPRAVSATAGGVPAAHP